MSEPVFIACALATDPPHVPSDKTNCVLCQVEVWISPASSKQAEAHNAKPICLNCFLKRIEDLPPGREVKIKPMTEEQFKEIKNSLLN